MKVPPSLVEYKKAIARFLNTTANGISIELFEVHGLALYRLDLSKLDDDWAIFINATISRGLRAGARQTQRCARTHTRTFRPPSDRGAETRATD